MLTTLLATAALAQTVTLPSELRRGHSATITVSGHEVGSTLHLIQGLGIGAGPCPPVLGGLCMGVTTAKKLATRVSTLASEDFTFEVHTQMANDQLLAYQVVEAHLDGTFTISGVASITMVQDAPQAFIGVLTDFDASDVAGWEVCHVDYYNAATQPLSSLWGTKCTGNNIMVACRPTNAPSYTVAAYAPFSDVTWFTGNGDSTTTHSANGAAWYYADSWSMGYVVDGQTVSKNSCDTNSTAAETRLCFHTGGGFLNGGWRCGTTTSLNASTAWQRVILQADL